MEGESSFRRSTLLKWAVAIICGLVVVQASYSLHWYVSSGNFVPMVSGGPGGGPQQGQWAPAVQISGDSTTPSSRPHTQQTKAPESPTPQEYMVPVPPQYFDGPGGRTWKKGTFCDTYVENTFQKPIGVCGKHLESDHSIKCYRNSESTTMVYCILESVFLRGSYKKMDVGLLTMAGGRSCPNLTLTQLHKTSEKNSQSFKLLNKVAETKSKPSSVCGEWFNKTAFLYTADQNVHIYFRMNAYYNLHKAIAREGVAPGDFVIIKHPISSAYLFSEWEKTKLFPEMINITDLPNKTLCFRKLVIVPYSYSGIPFRCKVDNKVRERCFGCKGRGMYGNSFYSFRQRVISSCGLVDVDEHTGNSIMLVSRTPYKRWRKDDLSKFQRLLENEEDLVEALKKKFPNTTVTVAHMEKLDICEQIQLAHDANVLMGVHGAGLVHLWWLQEDALILELNPTFQQANPSFRMLSTLTGRRYDSVTVTGSQHMVSVKVDRVIDVLKYKTHLS